MLSESCQALMRNKLMTLAAITTAGVSLLLLGGFLIGWLEVERQVSTLPDKFELRVFLRDDVTQEDTAAIRTRLTAMPELNTVRFVPKAEGWKKLQSQYDKELTADMPNPVPDSFVVKLKDLQYGDDVAQRIREMPEVDHQGVVYLKEEQRQVMAFMRFVRTLGFCITGALMFSTAVLIFNTIRLTVIARRREIRVMKLVGGSEATIRTPFLLEAMFHGGLGGLFGAVALWFAGGTISEYLPGFVRKPGEITSFLLIVVAMMAAGTTFGLLCGIFGTRRFLRDEQPAT